MPATALGTGFPGQPTQRILETRHRAEFITPIAESHPKVRAYVKNHNLGLEVPYRYGSEIRKYLPDFIVLVDDGHGPDDLLHLIVEIKGYRREDAKEKKSTMETYWVPGVKIRKPTAAGPSPSSLRFTRSRPTSPPRLKASSTRCWLGLPLPRDKEYGRHPPENLHQQRPEGI